jgi:hypothetical protein
VTARAFHLPLARRRPRGGQSVTRPASSVERHTTPNPGHVALRCAQGNLRKPRRLYGQRRSARAEGEARHARPPPCPPIVPLRLEAGPMDRACGKHRTMDVSGLAPLVPTYAGHSAHGVSRARILRPTSDVRRQTAGKEHRTPAVSDLAPHASPLIPALQNNPCKNHCPERLSRNTQQHSPDGCRAMRYSRT